MLRQDATIRLRCLAARVIVLWCAVPACGVQASELLAEDGGSATRVRSRELALSFRVSGTETARVDLWFTRDSGATWHCADERGFRESPVRFTTPAEGLYGFIIQPRVSPEPGTPPESGTIPQRWVFIDATPPLVQLDSVEPESGEDASDLVRLSWTAYDMHFAARPIGLWYKTSVEEKWVAIEEAIPNTGRYDWRVPGRLAGQVTLKLVAQDRGGHVVERIYGPVSAETWSRVPATQPTTRPATQPADTLAAEASPLPPEGPSVDEDKRREAERLFRQGQWYLKRGEYSVAAARYREALRQNPGLVQALNELADVHYLQNDYDQAVELYDQILKGDGRHAGALRGSYLAYLAQRKYPQSKERLESLLSIEPDDARAWIDLGDMMFTMGDLSAAREKWQRATEAGNTDKEAVERARRRLQAYQLQLHKAVEESKENTSNQLPATGTHAD